MVSQMHVTCSFVSQSHHIYNVHKYTSQGVMLENPITAVQIEHLSAFM